MSEFQNRQESDQRVRRPQRKRASLHPRQVLESAAGRSCSCAKRGSGCWRSQCVFPNRNRCKGLILAGTELPLILRDASCSIPFQDTAQIHVKIALRCQFVPASVRLGRGKRQLQRCYEKVSASTTRISAVFLSALRIGQRLLRRCIQRHRILRPCVCASMEISSFVWSTTALITSPTTGVTKAILSSVVAGQLTIEHQE